MTMSRVKTLARYLAVLVGIVAICTTIWGLLTGIVFWTEDPRIVPFFAVVTAGALVTTVSAAWIAERCMCCC